MTGAEMNEIRRRLKLNVVEFGVELGYSGNAQTISSTIRRYEGGSRPIPPWIATATRALDADRISDVIYKEVGDLLTFESIGSIAERIVDHLVREEDAGAEDIRRASR
jgi:hypothetical protein